MNWNTNEFMWLDWTVLAVGIVAIIWAIYRAIKKDKMKMKGADSQDYLFGKGELKTVSEWHTGKCKVG